MYPVWKSPLLLELTELCDLTLIIAPLPPGTLRVTFLIFERVPL